MDAAKRVYRFLFATEASARTSALIRILLACVCWSAFGRRSFLYLDLTAEGLLRSTVFMLATTAMLFGIWSRVASLVTGVCCLVFVYWYGIHEGVSAWTHHNTHFLAMAVFLTALTPCGKSYSFDRWLAIRRAEARGEHPPEEKGNVWGLRLLAIQLSTIYFWGAYDKCNAGFLSGARMEHYTMHFFVGSSYPESALFQPTMAVLAWVTVVFEFVLVVGLWFPRGRKWLVIPGMIMHGVFYWWLNVSVFTATVWIVYLAYFDPDAVHQLIERMSGHGGSARFGETPVAECA